MTMIFVLYSSLSSLYSKLLLLISLRINEKIQLEAEYITQINSSLPLNKRNNIITFQSFRQKARCFANSKRKIFSVNYTI